MATTVGEVVIELRAKMEALAADMNRAKGVVSSGTAGMQKAAQDVEKYLSQVGATAFKALGAATGVASAALVGLVKSGLDAGDALAKTADKLGITTQAMASLQYAADMAGVSQTALEGGLKKLAASTTSAATGTGNAAKAFQTLGLRADEIIKLPLDKQLGVVGDALKNVENESQRAAIAQKIFGKAGVDLLNLTKEGSAALADYAREAETLGLNLSRVDAGKIEAAGDAIARLGKGVDGLGRQLANKFSPLIKLAADAIFEMIEHFGGVEKIAGTVFDGLIAGAGFVADAIGGIRVAWLTFKAAFQTIAASVAGGFDALARTLTDAWNAIPFVDDINYEGTGIAGFLASMEAGVTETRGEIDGILSAPLPSKQFADYVADVETSMGAQAQATIDAQAASSGAIIGTETVTGKLAEKTEDLATAADKSAESINDQVRSLMAQQALLRMNELDQVRFNAQMNLAVTATDAQRLQVDALVVANYKAQQAAEAAAGGTDKQAESMRKAAAEADPWQKALTGAVERIDSAFADVWKGAFDGFSEFADSLKEAFKQLLAELAHQAITRPIVMQIGAALGLGGASGTALASGGGGMGSLLNLGSLFSTGKSVLSGFSSGGLSGGINALFGGSATGGWLGNAMSSARFAMGDLASSLGLDQLANKFNVAGLEIKSFGANVVDLGANLGAGFAGNWAGNKLGQSLFGERETTGVGGSLGGIVGSAWGPVGTLIGSFLGSLAENAIGKIFGLGDQAKWGKLGVTTGGSPTDGSGLQTVTAASGLSLTAVAKRTDDEAALQLLDAFVALDKSLTDTARGLGVTVDFAGKILGNTNLNVENEGALDSFGVGARLDEFSTDAIETAAADFVKAWIREISDDLPDRVRTYVNAYADMDATAEQLVQAFGFIADIDKLLGLDVVGAAAESAAKRAASAQQEMTFAYTSASDRVRELTANFDGSLESMTALTEALAAQKTVAAQMAQAYTELAEAVSKSLQSTIDMIRESQLGDAEKIAINRKKISDLTMQLETASDPKMIAELVSQIDSLVRATFSMVDAQQKRRENEQQEVIDGLRKKADDDPTLYAAYEAAKDYLQEIKAQGPKNAEEFIGILEQVDLIAQDRIKTGLDALAESEAALAETVDEGLAAFAASLDTLGATLGTQSQTAADQTTFAINAVNVSINAGTSAVVGAINGISTTVSAAVSNATAASTAAIGALTARLDAIEANARLEGARPGPSG